MATLGFAAPAAARGPFYEPMPWAGADFADTTIVLALGVEYVPSPRTATLVQAALAPWRLGPLRLASTWSFVSVRAPEGQSFGFGDPRMFARLRVAGRDTTAHHVWLDLVARIPTAQAKLFPYAWGGQEIEAGASFASQLARWTVSGSVARSWTEPGKGDEVGRSDLPHSWHATAWARRAWGAWLPQLRLDQLWMEDSASRSAAEASLTMRRRGAIDFTVLGGVEFGPQADRAADSWVHLRFATRLR